VAGTVTVIVVVGVAAVRVLALTPMQLQALE
jgi:hypothetical protein